MVGPFSLHQSIGIQISSRNYFVAQVSETLCTLLTVNSFVAPEGPPESVEFGEDIALGALLLVVPSTRTWFPTKPPSCVLRPCS
jgi:hypothetical protein